MANDSSGNGKVEEQVTVTIDGKQVKVPKGTNVIEAAKTIGVEIPHYCYHPNLSVAGNCRMCQVQVKGAPKLDIACNCQVREGMEVSTHHTSKVVADAQAATLEFILINHPLDCTVCDQAGQCKLQDYHYEYNARDSRFLENKEHKVKAQPLGPHVILDGERCILCSRCVRFCEEITQTNELGILNRGDKSVIAVNPGRELNNPLSATVVDLCPVGALTARDWRFKSRVWFTKSVDTICPGCSTGCNAKVYARDSEIVQVKGRVNQAVNKEWMCDEGRFGFTRYLPKERVLAPSVSGKVQKLTDVLKEATKLKGTQPVIFIDPHLQLEDMWSIKQLVNKHFKGATVALAYRSRSLTPVEAVLISPDYSPNFKGAEFLGLTNENVEKDYKEAVSKFRSGQFKSVIFVGDKAILPQDLDPQFLSNLAALPVSVALISDSEGPLASAAKILIPVKSVLEKSGCFVNRNGRLQYAAASLDALGKDLLSERAALNLVAESLGAKIVSDSSDREVTLAMLASESALSGISIAAIKNGGVALAQCKTHSCNVSSGAGEARV